MSAAGGDLPVLDAGTQAAKSYASPPKGSRRRTRTEGSSSNALRFLERSSSGQSLTQSNSSPSTAAPSPWPTGFADWQKPNRPRAWTLQSPRNSRLPRTSNLAFLERSPSSVSTANRVPSGTNVTAIATGAGADVGLGSLSGAVMATSSGLGGFLPQPSESLDDDETEASDEEGDDANVCPSMLFSCFPCLACLRPDRKRRPPSGRAVRESGGAMNDIRQRSRSQGSLRTPLLVDHRPPETEFPKDVKLIEVEVESARDVPSTEGDMANTVGTYVNLEMTPVQEGVGQQCEQTSVATRFTNPRWGGRDTFTFFVTDTDNAQAFLALQLLYRPLRHSPPLSARHSRRAAMMEAIRDSMVSGVQPGDVVVAEGFVDMLGLFPVHQGTYTPGALKGNTRRVVVPMREPFGKRRSKCTVMLGLRCRRVNETIDTHEDRLYEYQRWTQVTGWITTGKQRAGKWGTLDGLTFSDEFADVAPPAREDSEVVLPWCPFGGWEYSREEEALSPSQAAEAAPKISDGESENLALARKGAVWMEGYVDGDQAVRRRLWRRVYLDRTAPWSSVVAGSE